MTGAAAADGRLRGRVALVTGAARGIGLAAAERLAGAGARVAMADIDREAQEAAVSALRARGLDVLAIGADVADRVAADAMVAAAVDTFGGLDILVNNAGIARDTPIDTLTAETWRYVLATNLDSVVWVTQASLRYLAASGSASVVNIASTQGLRGQPDAAAYATAKGGVVNLTRTLAVDLGPRGIRVNAIAPGFIDTRMALQHGDGCHEHQTDSFRDVYIRHGRLPLRRPGTPEDVSGPILFLASDDSRYVTGQVLVVDGGFTCTY